MRSTNAVLFCSVLLSHILEEYLTHDRYSVKNVKWMKQLVSPGSQKYELTFRVESDEARKVGKRRKPRAARSRIQVWGLEGVSAHLLSVQRFENE